MRIVGLVVALTLVAGSVAGMPAQPARADGGEARGYVWASEPAVPDYAPVGGYWFNSARRAVTLHRAGTGRYAVTFAGLGGAGGVAHVVAYGWGNTFCTVVAWKPSGADEVVHVACFGPGGVPADSMFLADYARRTTVAAEYYSALYADNPGAVGPYTPPAAYRSDTFGAPATVERLAAGRYQVLDDTYAAARLELRKQMTVTAVGTTAVHCRLWDEANEGGDPVVGYLVQCTDAGGRPIDAAFTFTFVVGGNLLGDRPAGGYGGDWGRPGVLLPTEPAELWDSSTGLTPVLEWRGAGQYRAVFPGLGAWGGHVRAEAMGFAAGYCTVADWGPVAADLVVIVQCFDIVTSAPADVNLVGVEYTA
ncbi:hypothetical protein ODJ79_42730 [Actinoplanes sp. KI2]|uniref:hypothetical protein n=1 Tax=Actinoplanes sp. KI2 TaxID=2983315 RepID=UPI0021D5D97A|nr:hypothetical protein [Actinoplanes sp. KI2]MCU7730476.1 hypothetical protein [Actinoplanes sp. KI2]